MKRLLLLLMATIALGTTVQAQKAEVKAVKETISAFAEAGDNNDADLLATYLDDNYRVVMNRLFGSTEVAVLPRAVYLEKIRNKEFGGDDRKLTFEEVLINGPTASAKVTYKGTKMTFVSLVTLVQNAEGTWKLVSEVPVVL